MDDRSVYEELITSCLEQKTEKYSRKKWMLMLDAFRVHLKLDVVSAIHAMNTELVIKPGGMSTTKHSSE
jgi:hypothetical protein